MAVLEVVNILSDHLRSEADALDRCASSIREDGIEQVMQHLGATAFGAADATAVAADVCPVSSAPAPRPACAWVGVDDQRAEYAVALDNELMPAEGYRSANSGVALAVCPGAEVCLLDWPYRRLLRARARLSRARLSYRCSTLASAS